MGGGARGSAEGSFLNTKKRPQLLFMTAQIRAVLQVRVRLSVRVRVRRRGRGRGEG